MMHQFDSFWDKLWTGLSIVVFILLMIVAIPFLVFIELFLGDSFSFERPRGLTCVTLAGRCEEEVLAEAREDFVFWVLEESHMVPSKLILKVKDGERPTERLEDFEFRESEKYSGFETDYDAELMEKIMTDETLYDSFEKIILLNCKEELFIETCVPEEGAEDYEPHLEAYLSMNQARKIDFAFLEKYCEKRIDALRVSY